MFPYNFYAVVGIYQAVVAGKVEGDGARIKGAVEAEAVGGKSGGAAEIELHGVLKLVGVDTVDFCDFIVAVRCEGVKNFAEEFKKGKSEFLWEDCVQNGLAECPQPHH